MTLLDDHPTPRPPRRTWRDLPASPPIGDPFPPPNPADRLQPETDPAVESTSEMAEFADQVGVDSGRGGPRRRVWLIPAAAAVVAVLFVVVIVLATNGGDAADTTPTVPQAEAGSPAAVAEALGPAVVQIELAGGLDAGGGVGSGVIYDTTGLVLTAHHVVASFDEVVVRTADGRELDGRVVGRSPERDLAVVALDQTEGLVAAPLAEPDSVEVGETAIALGSPFGFQASVTAGII
jgi:putative serine protease PepD